ncbi:uncharacterized protein LOC111867273 isoform X2 [Cryptotermes secundus]|uniref:uncharacterized protein LOC111867273 isoform X2 n=1 Tax=Cryptotermes secundus TaxID=105785 RepID=UPI001454BEF3|nr:uncharacterized protein LOC111867273 isoform X2 [Cryptotermes secundus]
MNGHYSTDNRELPERGSVKMWRGLQICWMRAQADGNQSVVKSSSGVTNNVLSANYAIGPMNSTANVTEVRQNVQGLQIHIIEIWPDQYSDGNGLHEDICTARSCRVNRNLRGKMTDFQQAYKEMIQDLRGNNVQGTEIQ